ncbi:PIG-L deacetylase family protein [Stygiolobus caldivivus]|uniref:PIG-L family deacetylase n=1 Tax=Stygiolobus caldivivus TaxID=2824673 RepID=A0A8D5U792_9CREN|nr:PIG-L family deacetylase [Stygiolobus caldivivus]BCU70871.1 PIG-L family deacetylase [Stygiolobus caldivivus]
MRYLIVAPHPDDETLGCGGLIRMKSDKGEDVYVVFMTDGRYGSPLPEERGSKALIETRKKEAVIALSILGVDKDKILFLDFEDGKLKKNVKEAKIKLTNVIEQLKPDLIYYTVPIDAHSDHEATGKIVESIIKSRLGERERFGRSFLIWKPRLKARDPSIPLKYVKSFFFRRETEIIDISDYLEIKKKALNEYKSQVRWFSSSFIRRFIVDHETFFK